MVRSSQRRVDQLPSLPFLICGSSVLSVGPSSVVRDLGVWIDNGLTMSTHHQGRGRLLRFATTTAQRTTVSVARAFYTTRGRPRASAVGLLQRTPGWTSCQSTQPTAVRSPRGSTTDPRRPSTRPRYTAAAAVSLAVSAKTSDLHTLRMYRCLHGIGLNTSRKTSSSCPRFILTSNCVRPPVPKLWFLSHAGLHLATAHSRSQELERGTDTAQCHLRTIFVLIPATPEDIFFSSDNCVNNTNYCVVVLKCLALSITLILAN